MLSLVKGEKRDAIGRPQYKGNPVVIRKFEEREFAMLFEMIYKKVEDRTHLSYMYTSVFLYESTSNKIVHRLGLFAGPERFTFKRDARTMHTRKRKKWVAWN